MNEMPTPEIKTTSEILPSSPCTYIEILDDVICAPRAKVRKLVHLGQQMSQISQMLLQDETIGEAKRMAAVHMGEATVQVGLPMSECNEDGISENIRQQLLQFARTNGIVVDFNKARGENQPPIVLVSKYAKSRPDFIMRLATIQHVPEDNEAEDTEAEVVAVTTEHKKTEGDNVGQLLAGAEKAIGDALRTHIARGGGIVKTAIAYALLLNFDKSLLMDGKCQVFQVYMNFQERTSCVFEGSERISITDGLNRVLHVLVTAKNGTPPSPQNS